MSDATAITGWLYMDPDAVRAQTRTESEATAEEVKALLGPVRDGDQSAARRLVELLYPQVIRIVRSHLPRRSSEEDLAQEVFLKLFTRLDQYRGDMPLAHWVSRIAVTTCIDALRAQRRRPEWRQADLGEDEAMAFEHSGAVDWQPTPAEAMGARELVTRLLESLDPKDRLVISMLDIEGRSVADVQQVTGWGASMIKVRAFRARLRLRPLLQELEGRRAKT